MPVDQDHVPPALLQVQRRADADHACAQYQNVGLAVPPSGAPVKCQVVVLLPPMKLSIAASSRKRFALASAF